MQKGPSPTNENKKKIYTKKGHLNKKRNKTVMQELKTNIKTRQPKSEKIQKKSKQHKRYQTYGFVP